jgi:hypothetical protein
VGKSEPLYKRRKQINEASLKRRVVDRRPNMRILIVCEGQETERRYFEGFVDHLGLITVDVDVHGGNEGSAPISVVNFAERRASSEGRPEDGGYDIVFCVFDRDTHTTYEEAKSKVAELKGSEKFPAGAIEAITSVPCFEIWLLYHFTYCRAPFAKKGKKSAGDCAVDKLRSIEGFESYKKAISQKVINELLELTEVAIKNSEKALQDVTQTGEENPSTLVHRIAKYLRGAKSLEQREAEKSKLPQKDR